MRALFLVVLLAPVASACSLAGPVPGPGTFTLVPWDGGHDVTVVVEGRMLGAGCELSNVFSLRDGVFAWLEYTQAGREWAWREVHILDLATGEKRIVRADDGSVESFALVGGTLVYMTTRYGEPAPSASLVFHDLATGTSERMDLVEHGLPRLVSDGRHVAWTLRENWPQGPDLVSLLDVETRAWLLRDVRAPDLVGDEHVQLVAMGGGWLVMQSRSGSWLHALESGTTRPWGGGDRASAPMRHVSAILDGYAYEVDPWGSGPAVSRTLLPDGPREPMDVQLPQPFLGVGEGYWVTGRYSAPEHNPWGRWWWVEEYAALLVIGLVAVGGSAGAVWWRATRR